MEVLINGIIVASILSIVELHDITTIYPFYGEGDHRTVECHSRTSALGYPTLMKNVLNIDGNINGELPPCSPKLDEDLCSNWTLTNWQFLPNLDIPAPAPPLYMRQWNGKTNYNSFTDTFPFLATATRVYVKTTKENRDVFICLLSGSSISETTEYILKLSNSKVFIYKCGERFISYRLRLTVDMPGGISLQGCRIVIEGRYTGKNWVSSSDYQSLNINVSNQQVSVMGYTYDNIYPITVNYIVLGSFDSIYYRVTTGCGRNRYGNDCGGLCSGSSSGCRGMRLCREMVGCDCAPGFKGAKCSEPCSAWEYGAGCKQKCSFCSGSPCDAFTGECPGKCQEGFRAPFCSTPYTYFKSPPLMVLFSFKQLTISFSLDADNFKGEGHPKFYEVQIRRQDKDDEWREETPCLISAELSEKPNNVVVYNISNLSSGRKYTVRVILYDDDGSSYKGEEVPQLMAETKCIVPDNFDYNLQPRNIASTSFNVTWNAWPGEDSEYCPLLSYKVYLRDALRWTEHGDTMMPVMEATGKIPDTEYQVKIETFTVTGRVSKSKILPVETSEREPSAVVNLRVTRKDAEEVELQWNKPLYSGRNIRLYEVSYECLAFIAKCPLSCQNSKERLNVTTPAVILHDLLPFAQYEVKVTAYNAVKGWSARLLLGTEEKVPDIAPELSEIPVVNRTNTSFVLNWNPPRNCSLVNGFLTGYMYEVRTLGENPSRLRGKVRSTTALLANLMPYTEYEVRVYVLSSAGWNPEIYLAFSAKTKPAVPDVVQNLTVYKKGRNTVGLRWSPPEDSAGNLTGFSISYLQRGVVKTETVPLKPCKPWPNMYCHKLKGLRFENEYNISVRGMNEGVNDQGEAAIVKATTVEEAPDAPPYLRVTSKTASTLRVEWGHPFMVNGILRSFLINVEQVDTYSSSECCKYYPIAEHLVKSEEESYQYEFSDLDAASTYTVSVSAKTVSMGPAVTLTASTKPPTPLMANSPSVLKEVAGNGVVNVTIEAPQEYEDITSAYLVLVFPQETSEVIQDEKFHSPAVQEEVSALVNKSFYVAAEFSQETMESRTYITLGTEETGNGNYAAYENPPLTEGTRYSVGLMLILEYLSERSFGFSESEEFFIPP